MKGRKNIEENRKMNRRTFLKLIGATSAALTGPATVLGKAKESERMIFIPDGRKVPESNVKSRPNAGVGVKPEEAKPDLPEHPENIPTTGNTPAPSNDTHKWLAYSRDDFVWGTYSEMQADFTVPEKPMAWESTNYPNMFYFPALQNCDSYCNGNRQIIVQPVLQWNWESFETGEGYPQEWAISAWWADTNDNMEHGEIIKVSPGDRLWGYLNYQSDGRWYVEIYNYTTGEYSDLYTPDFSSYSWDKSYCTLEAAGYDEGDCKQLPGNCTFENIYFEDSSGNATKAEWGTHWDNVCDVYAEELSTDKIRINTPVHD